MTNRDLRNALLALLKVEFEPYGFVLNKAKAEFTRRVPDGWQKLQLVFLVRSEGWEINPALLVRKNVVENLYHQASYFEAKYHKITPTIGLPIADFIQDGHDYRFHLNTEADLSPAFQDLVALFKQVAIPFFQQYDSLKDIEKEVNTETRKSIFPWLNQGSVGLILAKLVASPQYDQLEKRYRSYYEQLSKGFYLSEYEGVVELLKNIKVGNA